MKRLSVILLFFLCVLFAQAQNLSVQNFRLDEADMTANTHGTIVMDQNGQKCALIKMITTQTGFTFDAGALGVVKTEQKVGEIWIYVPEGVKRLTISHPQLGQIRDYDLGQTLRRARTYVLYLTTGEVQTTVKQARTSQFVLFQLSPPNAVVTLNGELLSTQDGTASKMMRFGTYDYQVMAPNYLPEVGKVTVNDPKNKHVVNVSLKPNFARVTLTVDNNAEIWVNGERKGTGTWTDNLGAGTYEFETRLANHRPVTVTRDISASTQPQTIQLQAPIPIYGEAEINSSPAVADIYIDGQKHGQTPQLLDQLLIGQHQLRLSKQGYADYNGSITIREGETTPVSASLSNTTTISSTNPPASLNFEGVNQDSASGQKQTFWSASETPNPNHALSVLDISTPPLPAATDIKTVMVDEVMFNMIFVDGGTFERGATSEQGSDAYNSESPSHQVTLSPYYIAETEVTQDLWLAVMGKNPSNFKGNRRPVESVSWQDCQSFIKKLNKITGLKFRLPTEAEWEYAARGGKKAQGSKYSGNQNLVEVAWYKNNSSSHTHDVKTKLPNELGIYDMSGNVLEWCQDWYGDYSAGSQMNPTGASSGSGRVCRGGCWCDDARNCRVAYRDGNAPGGRFHFIGLRLALQ